MKVKTPCSIFLFVKCFDSNQVPHLKKGYVVRISTLFVLFQGLNTCQENRIVNFMRVLRQRIFELIYTRAKTIERYTRKNAQVVTNLQQTCSNAVPTTCQQVVFALLVPSLFTSCHRLLATRLLSSTDLLQIQQVVSDNRFEIQQVVSDNLVAT